MNTCESLKPSKPKRTHMGGAVGCPSCNGAGGYCGADGSDMWFICPCTRPRFRGFCERSSGDRCEEQPHRFEVCS